MLRYCVALLFIGQLLMPSQSAHALLKKGEPLPELSGTTITGEPFSSENLRGRPTILKIGTTWCGTCKAQTKALNKLRDYLRNSDVQYVDVFVQETAGKVQRYFEKNGVQQPDKIVLDDGEIARKLNIYLIPRVLVIDQNLIVQRDGPNMTAAKIRGILEEILSSE